MAHTGDETMALDVKEPEDSLIVEEQLTLREFFRDLYFEQSRILYSGCWCHPTFICHSFPELEDLEFCDYEVRKEPSDAVAKRQVVSIIWKESRVYIQPALRSSGKHKHYLLKASHLGVTEQLPCDPQE